MPRLWTLAIASLLVLGACTKGDGSYGRKRQKKDSSFSREYAERITIDYTDSGLLRARVYSPQMTAVKDSKEPYMLLPKGLKVDFMDTRGQIESYMTAEWGVSYKNKKRVVVRRNVEILNIKGEMLNTEELIWNQETGKIRTDKFVTITTPDQIITGDGLISNQSFTDWEILNVRGTLNKPHDPTSRSRTLVPGRGRY